MSIFSSRTTKTLEIPFDAPHTVTIQKLKGRHMGGAHDAYMQEFIGGLKKMGTPEERKGLESLVATAVEADPDAAPDDPMAGFDRYYVLEHGIVAWSYEHAVTAEAIDDLDDDAGEFIALAILRLSKPSLFKSQNEAEAERKNA